MKLKTTHSKFTRYLYSGLLFIFCISMAVAQPTVANPDGFAASQGTTGGGNASPQTVNSASAFRSAVSGDSPAVIIVNGRFNLGGDVTIGSNKTVIGMNENSGLYGGTVKIQGTNYIIQNLTFGPSSNDVMEISGATRVFVTKCTFHDSTDELCSIVREADYVTVSWSRFYFDTPDSHSYAHLIGNSDNATEDRGKLHVTLHHNWYDNGVKGRQPRVRFGQVHIYNCYYGSNNTDYCIGTGKECHIRVENTHFDNVDDPWEDFGGSSDGEMGWSNLRFDGISQQPTYISNSFPVFSLPYSYSLDAVNSTESIVKAGAGNVISGSSGNMIVRARGVVGNEQIQLVVNGSAIQTWTLSTSYQDYAANASGSNVQVHFINDDGTRDVQIDYMSINGTTFQSENQPTNTGVWTGTCGGSYSEWLHCNGYIQYGGSSTNAITIQENTTGFCSVDGTVDNDNSGFTGSGFSNTDNASGNGITWSVNTPGSGTYSLTWRMANNGGSNRTAEVIINGAVQISNVDFPDTGSWTSWSTTSTVNVNLLAGTNSIRLQATNSSGLANIDYMEVSGSSPTASSCSSTLSTAVTLLGDTSERNVESGFIVHPNPFTNMLTIELTDDMKKATMISVYDTTGKLIINKPVKEDKPVLTLNNIQPGLYLIKVSNADKSVVKRIVKQ